MLYREVTDLLGRHTEVVELSDGHGAHVAVCPRWQGRVMTSTCSGPEGPSLGFVNRPFIEAGKPDAKFSNYGGEDRLWLSPEGGPFSLWFARGAAQTLENWCTPPALNEVAWEVVSESGDPDCVMATEMELQNASASRFALEVARRVRLLGTEDLRGLFGGPAVEVLDSSEVEMVAFETVNEITNRGSPMTRDRGLVSIWILGMLPAGRETVVIVPYRPGPEAELGPVVRSDYFGPVPPERLRVTPGAVLFVADGDYRAKIGTSQRRARNVLGSVDFAGRLLTVVRFTMPEDPTEHDYLSNMWGIRQAEPYVGDVANSYNDGPSSGGPSAGFYEIESLSPAVALATGESLLHRHRTIHLRAELDVLSRFSEGVLGVDLETVRQQMAGR